MVEAQYRCRVMHAQARQQTGKRPRLSGFYDFYLASPQFLPGVGNIGDLSCMIGGATQPSIYAGNMLLDCDAQTPHNETTIAVDPNNPDHALGGYHARQLHVIGGNVTSYFVTASSVTFDGGQHWQQVIPPTTPYDFSGDPGLTFTESGRIYFSNAVTHETPGGPMTAASIAVAHSDDGGLTWSNPVTVVQGRGAFGPQ